MSPDHPFLKRPSQEIPAVRVIAAPSHMDTAKVPMDWAFTGVLGLGLGVIATLLVAAVGSSRIPPIVTAVDLGLIRPSAAVVVPPLTPTAVDLREEVARIGDMVVFAPRPAPVQKPAVPATVTPTPAPTAAPAPATAFAEQVVLYRPPAPVEAPAAPQNHEAPATGSPQNHATSATAAPAYHIVSIASADLALIGMDINGQSMVSPFRVGQSLPDGRTITAIDLPGHRIVTNAGSLAAP